MSTFIALVRVVHIETWIVEAEDEREARTKFVRLTEDVMMDTDDDEVVNWEVMFVADVVEEEA